MNTVMVTQCSQDTLLCILNITVSFGLPKSISNGTDFCFISAKNLFYGFNERNLYMSDNKKELEQEHLEEVTGGGYFDSKAVEDALFNDMSRYPDLGEVYRQARGRVNFTDDPVANDINLATEMLSVMGVTATIRHSGGDNVYYYQGRQISQNDVLKIIAGYKQNQLYRWG